MSNVDTAASVLFSSYALREVTLRNRIALSPMCMFGCEAGDGVVTDWHVAHYSQFAMGGVGLVIAEATAVMPDGRVTPRDAGLWSDAHVAPWRRVTDAVHAAGSAMGVQLMHAGRKGSLYPGLPTDPPDHVGSVPVEDGGWPTLSASGIGFGDYAVPREATDAELHAIIDAHAGAAARAVIAGFDVIMVQAAHGYLLHEFLSPVTNHRTDAWGQDRASLLELVVRAIRGAIPETVPVIVRLSVEDVVEGGVTVADTADLAVRLHALGVDLIDCSSGGLVAGVEYDPYPGYQVPGAAAVRATGIPASAVGMITDHDHAESIVAGGDADLVMLGRELLRDPAWARRAGHALHLPATMEPRYHRAYRRPQRGVAS